MVRAKRAPETLNPGRRRPLWEQAVLRGIDVVGAAVGLAVLAPPMLIVAGIIRLTSRGPALFRQRRVGQGGKPFTLYKFRTMQLGCSDEPLREMIARELRGEKTSVGGSFKLDRDPRITSVGSWLRRTSFDELPQLLNVLRGDMALVGPRPCLEWEAAMFPPEFAARSAVKPGLTGLWQVSGRSTMGTLDMLRLDLVYVRSRSLQTDLGILARTLPSMLRGGGAR
ncbi:Sugar transferase involved in LPS biosynthesis (colanic, teichoic acid) [Saccharopolyspora antimicrobica]|uniref:Lipopolysaccharide/colanic/teichoic acid biosynthesis glycosyltransferase n=2 Tax=Saccharopolyspora antimicrobica TaxID=455193 RepID=A0A1I4W195_9PSEU|nr:lipopolysaccharide/colanic/teichoic acid biosynthesis glycosyltransferase [Saccharopolyspora antimicrobica]SFN07195.1 Sugar transferase involved in LPS biosynthesis (colanic, teichoic acid) [Saccharopolyspora antimicrobica]